MLRRRLEAGDPRSGTRSYIRVLRVLEKFSLAQLSAAVEYALDIDVVDPDSLRTIVEHRAKRRAELFRLDGRPHLAHVRVETTCVASYNALLEESHDQDRHEEHGPAGAPPQAAQAADDAAGV